MINKIEQQRDKLKFLAQHLLYFWAPDAFRRYDPALHLDRLSSDDRERLYHRLHLLNKLDTPFTLSSHAVSLAKMRLGKHTNYQLDFAKALKGHSRHDRFDVVFGDVMTVPDSPSIVKTRPITEDNKNGVLLKLNTPRHYRFHKDPYSWEQKKNSIVFRGKPHKDDRRQLIIDYAQNPITDIQAAYRKGDLLKNYLSPTQQMEHKFILSLEGNDVASNLKWVMASNSLVVMKKPRFESWFLETQLIPGVHYIEANEDFSNLEEVMEPYLSDQSLAKEMMRAKREYVEPYLNQEQERLLCYLVLQKYLNFAEL